MISSQPEVIFSQDDVQKAAAQILQARPDPIPTYRLLKEVLRLPAEDKELQRAQAAAMQSKWVKQLEGAQLPDGSWGRFHSQDTKAKTVFRTSEEAIDRAFSLGLSSDHPVLARVKLYIENVLRGHSRITDWEEKNDAWPVFIRIILAGKLAEIDPSSRVLDPHWNYMIQVACHAFSTGNYCLADETHAYLQLSEVHMKRSFLQSRYAISLLSARPLPAKLERALVEWLWFKPDGMSYLQAPLSSPAARVMAYWLKSMNIFSHIPSWRRVSVKTLNQIWTQRDGQGWWDYGRQSAMCADFPISENWRQQRNRKVDFSTFILSLLRRYFD